MHRLSVCPAASPAAGWLKRATRHANRRRPGFALGLTACLLSHALAFVTAPAAEAQSAASATNQPLATPAQNADRPNVLLILVDDLKPAIGAYGDATALTPNLDKLVNSGMRFDNAYCNQAVCASSRYTLLSGARSTSSGIYGFGIDFRRVYPDATTMPQFFKDNGYHTESMGKVFHIGHGNHNDEQSWSVPHHKDLVIEYVLPESTEGGKRTREEALFGNDGLPHKEFVKLPRGMAWEAPEGVPDNAYADGRVAEHAIDRLKSLQQSQAASNQAEPFFMAVGFARPHMPFTAPKRYWDLYDPAKLPMPETNKAPQGAPGYAPKRGIEIDAYKPVPTNIPSDQYSPELARQLIHGYYASTSYVDAQIGKVLASLQETGLDKNTVVLLWGDHGFHLGDLGIWTKHTNYEQATHIPFVIRAPGLTQPRMHTKQMASTVDVFPTLAALCGLPDPTQAGLAQPVDGQNLVPVLQDPSARLRPYAYHCYPRGNKLGRAIRTERYRLVEWKPIPTPKNLNPEGPIEYELYDYQDSHIEWVNIVDEHPEIVAELKKYLDTEPEASIRAAQRIQR